MGILATVFLLLIGSAQRAEALTELAPGATGYFGGEEVHCSAGGLSHFAKAYYECKTDGAYVEFDFRLVSEQNDSWPKRVGGTTMDACNAMASVLAQSRGEIRQFTEIAICATKWGDGTSSPYVVNTVLNTYVFTPNARVNQARSQGYPSMESCVQAANEFNRRP
jgi:hypothetical protein